MLRKQNKERSLAIVQQNAAKTKTNEAFKNESKSSETITRPQSEGNISNTLIKDEPPTTFSTLKNVKISQPEIEVFPTTSSTNLEMSLLAIEEPHRSNHKVLIHSFKDDFLFSESSEESESSTESEDDDDRWFCANCQKVTPPGSKRKKLDD